MPWLVRDGEVLASLEVAGTRRARAKGLLGRDEFGGAVLLPRTRSVHTFGMRFAIDVAFLDDEHRVLKVTSLRRGRLALPVRGARSIIEARAGSFRDWNLACGDELEVK